MALFIAHYAKFCVSAAKIIDLISKVISKRAAREKRGVSSRENFNYNCGKNIISAFSRLTRNPYVEMQDRPEAALIALRRILRATEFNSRNIARASGLTPSQVLALQFLSNRGEATPKEIATHASLKQATITTLLDRLEERKLIRRRRDAKDGRRVLVTLTASGKKALDASPDGLQQLFEERFQKLNDWEQSAIIASLERVASLLDAEDIEAGPILDIGALHEPPKKEH